MLHEKVLTSTEGWCMISWLSLFVLSLRRDCRIKPQQVLEFGSCDAVDRQPATSHKKKKKDHFY